MITPWQGADLAKDPIEKLLAGYDRIGVDRATALVLIRAVRANTPALPIL